MKKTYDEILGEVYCEKYQLKKVFKFVFPGSRVVDIDVAREAAERYRAQVELPSDEEIEIMFPSSNNTMIEFYINGGGQIGAKWLRERIKLQLNERK